MRQADSRRRIARAMERARARAALAPTRGARNRSRGQAIIIFTLLFTALLGFMGLAIDSARVYDQYARMQRAAEAGALAGVIYMPNNYTTNLSTAPNDDAICRALQEVSKNGFGSFCNPGTTPSMTCPPPASTIGIAVCPVSGQAHELQVFVTQSIDVVFLSALGVGPLTITTSAIAQYLPPVDVAVDPGAPGGFGSWGTFGECNGASSACLGSGVRNWSGNINGPGDLKEMGDPLVTCEEGPTGPPNIDTPVTNTTPPTIPTFVGMPTNHPQHQPAVPGTVPAGCNNTDQANSFTGPSYSNGSGGVGPQHTGYAFFVHVPSGDTENLWVWNAPFSPNSKNSCNGRTGGNSQSSYDVFYYYNCQGSNSSSYPFYPNTISNPLDPTGCSSTSAAPDNSPYTCNSPYLFFAVTYSIYAIPNVNDPAGVLVASFTAMPYEVGDHAGCSGFWQADSSSAPFAGRPSGCLSSSDPTAGQCIANWCPVANKLGDTGALWSGAPLSGTSSAAGVCTGGCDYRVMVVAADYGDPTNWNAGYGGHSYSLKLCPPSVTTQLAVQTCNPTSGAVVGGWSFSDVLFVFPGNGGGGSQTTEYPLGFAGPEFAGRTMDVRLFDEGDLQGTNNSLKGHTTYAVAPPIPGYTGDPCAITAAQLTAAGYSSSNFLFPSGERSNKNDFAMPGVEGSLNGDLLYNGLWVDEQIALPSAGSGPANYQGGEWTVCATAPQTNDGDVLALDFTALGESPVHLV